MKKLFYVAAACGLSALTVHAEDAAPVKSAYVTASVMQSAGVSLDGEGFPGAGVESWLSKPADQVVPLVGDMTALLSELKRVGDVSVLSGNEAVMHLSTGSYERFKGSDGRGLITSKGIDVRLSPGQWPYAAAILPASGSVPGFIFFNSAGVPVHRILLTETSNVAEFDAIVAQFKGDSPAIALTPVDADATETPTEATKAALLEGWRKMQDTHEFSGLLNDHKISRIDAARIAEGEFTAQLDPAAYDVLFEQLMKQEAAIMFFAMNDGCVQISTGAITEINRTRGTLQLVEDDSRTLVSLPRIAQVWRVSKPTERGLIHSLELYDANGQILALLFGSEKGDSTNIVTWKELLFALPLAGEGPVKVAGETAEAPAAL